MAIYSQLYNRDWDRGKQKIAVFKEETIGRVIYIHDIYSRPHVYIFHVYSNTKYMVVMQ
jgi:hypothetical protein